MKEFICKECGSEFPVGKEGLMCYLCGGKLEELKRMGLGEISNVKIRKYDITDL